MSKINAVRLINVNYNNNAIRISDECFHFNGESTLLSLRNGGGKSVLVQMMTAPFVHKRYRDAKDRPFESYFTTNKPSFILVEWVLDQGAGYVMTGIMVRKNQDTAENEDQELEMVNIISEYQASCPQDIHHLPVLEKGKKEMVLKNFTSCRQLFESYKKDHSVNFFCYDMNNSAQSRQYFDKLKEYQINYKEWETIIKKVNLKESGLSDLFSDCKDEKGLVEKWFLDAVESKLNKEKNRMKEFQVIMEKHVGQYKANQSKIKRRDNIRIFKEEAEKIREKAEHYQEAGMLKLKQENKIAGFIARLNELSDLTKEKYEQMQGEMEELHQALLHVEYEKISSEIHSLEEKKRFHAGNRDMIEMEQESLEDERSEIEKRLHLMLCAKQLKVVEEDKEELEVMRQKLRVFRKNDQELEPERKALGYALKCHFEKQIQQNVKQQEACVQKLEQTVKSIGQEKEKTAELEQNLRDTAQEKGVLQTKIQVYDQQEESFNGRYQEQLVRNILGEYEPGEPEIRQEAYEKELKNLSQTRLDMRKQLESGGEERRRLERSKEDLQGQRVRQSAKQEQQERQREQYEKELEERKVILKYLNLEERALFDREKILHASERKLVEIGNFRRSLEKEEDRLQKDYQALTQGKVLELPKELEQEFSGRGIHVVYGMEWLRKNGFTEAQNKEMVRRHPFLPYALILPEAELEKLSRQKGDIYTSLPIPIIVREQLEEKGTAYEGNLHRMPGVSFYVLFNENLLDEEKLRLLIQKKESEIEQIQDALKIRQTEYREYFERQELIRNQSVSRETYEENENLLKELGIQIAQTDTDIRQNNQELEELKKELERLDDGIRKAERDIEWQKNRLKDYESLLRAYEIYEQNRRTLEQIQKKEVRFQEAKDRSMGQLAKLMEEQKTLETDQDGLLDRARQLRDTIKQYQRYEKTEEEAFGLGRDVNQEVEELTPAEMEARYAAITAHISQELKELESQEQRASKRYEESADELSHLQEKYGLSRENFQEVHYNRKEETHQEVLLKERIRKIDEKKRLWNEEEKHIAVVTQQIAERTGRLCSEFAKEEPLPKAEIKDLDFDGRINKLKHQENELQKTATKVKLYLDSYSENLTALAEYNTFSVQEPVEWDRDFEKMNGKELRDYKGILIRDYNQRQEEKGEAKGHLVRVLNLIIRMEVFKEDYYRKPLEAMLELSDDAGQVLRQLDTTIMSYESLMEKLEVDISVVEKERNRIVELIEDYVREVHQNLGKIDQNSTITIRERPVKMLKIQLPEWEENEGLYRMRLQDMIDEITQKGVGIFERNENAQEYFGIQITTKNLYDTVIGIGNVQIRLYKVEEQREYPITWAEVARNSGGEGFLSAFVILTSLLYYMRKDDTDIFAERNEGKVLLMDNPFAQTNAAHLLKPLMDMAKKTNTQLICLTGLGGESIYNRFDNIYVLNLIAASLRNGMQYLKADHLRGNEPETMMVSQIEVVGQQELVF